MISARGEIRMASGGHEHVLTVVCVAGASRGLGTRLVLIAVTASLTACIGSDTTRCAGLICPASAVCSEVHGRCVYPEQLNACAEKNDGDPCELAGAEGRCRNGLCIPLSCGDGVITAPEECDGTNVGTATCLGLGYYEEGTGLGCYSDCTFDRSGCSGFCGDHEVNGAEQCDLPDLGDTTDCTQVGFYDPAALGCNAACRYDVSDCTGFCGDDVANGPEECDGDDLGNATDCRDLGYYDEGALACAGNCRYDVSSCARECGDGTIDPEEQCEPGNLDGKTCRDFGFYTDSPGLACSEACTFDTSGCSSFCGDGVWDEGEEDCDGTDLGGKTCQNFGYYYEDTLECTGVCGFDLTECTGFCGDGIKDPLEDCDGASLDEKTCQSFGYYFDDVLTCTFLCSFDTSGCTGYCGDGIKNGTEACDAGELNSSQPDAPCRPLCLDRRCGDGVIDPVDGEICDFGDQNAGDGCSYDCKSDETCPNGIPDYTVGELCDDGNFLSHDGCTYGCRPEAPTWSGPPQSAPHPRYGHAMAYDDARGRTVLFGGFYDDGMPHSLADTWEWNGAAWVDSTPPDLADSPPGRMHHAMAYDAARGRLVLFGGYFQGLSTSRSYGDTWEWDGARWIDVTPTDAADSPSARWHHAMAYDSARRKVVLFSGGLSADTWEWDGAQWHDATPADPADSPPARWQHAMAYDPVRGKVVLFGGNTGLDPVADTWEWDGMTWHDVTPANPADSPPPLTDHAMAYDPVRGQVVLFGGPDVTPPADTWAWDGTRWLPITPADPADSPIARSEHAMAYDARRSRVVLFGGVDDTTGPEPVDLADTWEWDGTRWADRTAAEPAAAPTPRLLHVMAYDASRGRVLLFGGYDGSPRADTWEWDGAQWLDVTPADPGDSPPARWLTAMAYDADRGKVMLFGGYYVEDNVPYLLADTWEWDGDQWTELTPIDPADSPSARSGHTLAFDDASGQLVLFGGYDLTDRFADTWVWNETRWVEVTPLDPDDSPLARDYGAMAYDELRGRIVLFGGRFDPGFYQDTWEWDGSVWVDVTPTGPTDSPTWRDGHAMTYDAALQRVLLACGYDGGNRNDLWAWTGSRWEQIPPADPGEAPARRRGTAMAYDAAHGNSVLFGGSGDGGTYLADTRLFRYEREGGRDDSCLQGADSDMDGYAGCADPDCWAFCTPRCAPGITCAPEWPHCGDGACDTELESCRLCPDDCGACDVCGDFVCDPAETIVDCPGDCTPP